MAVLKEFGDDQKCIFCKDNVADELRFGKIYKYEDVITHYFCMLFSAEVEQNGKDDEGIQGFLPEDIKKESDRADKILCTYCRTVGASISCNGKGCRKKFHYSCGVDNGSLHQFFDNFKSFCVAHRKVQTVPPCTSTEKHICLMCYDEVKTKPSLSTIWAPCCKTAWYHRKCIQKMALNGGYFFRCPKCNNKDIFRREMLECGIYIPDQDASWELEPHAYEELGQRHNVCDAEICRCPEGRSFQSIGTWELLLCMLCGSQGTHYPCSKTAVNDMGKWSCSICSPVANKSVVIRLQPVEETQGPSNLSIPEETRTRHRSNCRPGRRRRIGSDNDNDVSKSKRRVMNSFSSDDSDSESTSSCMSGQVNSNGVVKFNATTANILEDSEENESDVENDVRSYARFENQPVIIRPSSLVQANVIDLDSDDDVVPSPVNCTIISSDNNEVTSTSVDDNIILEDDDDDDDDDDVVFVNCDESRKNVDDDLPQPTALLRFVENNQVFIVSPSDIKRRGGIENLTSAFNPPSSTGARDSPLPTRSDAMWQSVPLHKSVVHSFAASEISDPVTTNCGPLDKYLEKNSNRDSKKLRKELEVICID